MKLRIRGNSVRIRLSQSEMTEIVESGKVQDVVEFGSGRRLIYQVKVVPETELAVSYEGDCITVCVPRERLERWQAPREVSIDGQQRLDDGTELTVLVEKDFACLVPREGEEDADSFPNPGRVES